MAKLAVLQSGAEIQLINLKEIEGSTLKIGRAEDCEVRLSGRAVGREHAILRLEDHKLWIEKRSKFGQVLLNGHATDSAEVKPGDVISIADYQVEIREGTKIVESAAAFTSPSAVQEASSFKEIAPVDVAAFADVAEVPISEQKTGNFELNADDVVASEALELQPALDVFAEQNLDKGHEQKDVTTQSQADPNSFKIDLGSKVSESLSREPSGIEMARSSSAIVGGDKTAVIAQEKIEAIFTFAPGAANYTEYKIEKAELSIGRGSDCDIVLNDKTASRKHCIIRRVGVGYVLQDLGSGNGTLVNDHKVTDAELASGDKIQIGDTVFEFRAVNLDYVQKQHEYMNVPHEEEPEHRARSSMSSGSGNTMVGSTPIPPQPGVSTPFGIPGLGGAGANAGTAKKETLLSKFRKLPPKKQIVVGLLFGVLLWFATAEGPKQKRGPNAANSSSSKEDQAFNKLSPEKKQFVINTYQLAYDYYKNLDYNRALFEIKKVLEILPEGYKDSKDLKVYAEKAIEMEQAKLEEKKRKEDAERIRKEVAEFLVQAEAFVKEEKEAEAREVFVKIFERDPENAMALRLKQELDEKVERKRRDELAKFDAAEKRKQLLELLAKGRALLKKEKYYAVIDLMIEAPATGSTDEKLLNQAKGLAATARKLLDEKTKPFLASGNRALDEGNFVAARDAFLSALNIDSKNKAAKLGLERVKEELRKVSRNIYTQAVLLESISNLEEAKTKFQECLAQAMPGDIYYERCERKLKRYQVRDAHSGSDVRSTASSSASPSLPGAGGGEVDPEMPKFEEHKPAPEAGAQTATEPESKE